MTRRALIVLLPYAIFLASLAPYPGLLQRTVGYQSTNNAPLWSAYNVANIAGQIGWIYLFGAAMVLSGLWYRRRGPVEQYAVYCCCLVAYSCAMANHYTVIPIVGLVMGWNRWAAAYVVVASLFALASDQGIGWQWLEGWLHVSGDGTGALSVYRVLDLCLLLHLATRD